MGICYIVGAGDCAELPKCAEGDFLIAADGGYRHLAARGITPDLLLGDLDSFTGELPSCPLLRYPAEKDDTDTALAIRAGEERGYREFRIYGALGGDRLDHTVAMLATLAACALRGLHVTLFGGRTRVFALASGEKHFSPPSRGYLSVFAACGAAEGVTLTGLKYTLTDATLTPDRPLGVSNEFLPNTPACVAVKTGCLILIWNEE